MELYHSAFSFFHFKKYPKHHFRIATNGYCEHFNRKQMLPKNLTLLVRNPGEDNSVISLSPVVDTVMIYWLLPRET